MNLIKRLLKEEEGQGMIEYALIAALISIIAIVAITASGVSINTIWTTIQTKLEAADGP